MQDRLWELWSDLDEAKARAERTHTRVKSAESVLGELEDRDRRRAARTQTKQKSLTEKYPTLRS